MLDFAVMSVTSFTCLIPSGFLASHRCRGSCRALRARQGGRRAVSVMVAAVCSGAVSGMRAQQVGCREQPWSLIGAGVQSRGHAAALQGSSASVSLIPSMCCSNVCSCVWVIPGACSSSQTHACPAICYCTPSTCLGESFRPSPVRLLLLEM